MEKKINPVGMEGTSPDSPEAIARLEADMTTWFKEPEDDGLDDRLAMDACEWPTRRLVGDIKRVLDHKVRAVVIIEILEALRSLGYQL
jgi:hypothetical protein